MFRIDLYGTIQLKVTSTSNTLSPQHLQSRVEPSNANMAQMKTVPYLLVIVSLCCLAEIAKAAAIATDTKASKIALRKSLRLEGIVIPNFRLKSNFGIANADIKFSRIDVKRFKGPSSDDIKETKGGFKWTIKKSKIKVTGNWRWNVKKVLKDNGRFTLDSKGITIRATVKLDTDSKGRIIFNITKCKTKIKSTEIKLKRGLKCFYKFFSKSAKKTLKKKLERAICVALKRKPQLVSQTRDRLFFSKRLFVGGA